MTKKKQNSNSCLPAADTKTLVTLIDEKLSALDLKPVMEKKLQAVRESVVTCVSSSDTGEKKKRKPSAYNVFIGNCMRGSSRNMKDCATDYKVEKAKNEKK